MDQANKTSLIEIKSFIGHRSDGARLNIINANGSISLEIESDGERASYVFDDASYEDFKVVLSNDVRLSFKDAIFAAFNAQYSESGITINRSNWGEPYEDGIRFTLDNDDWSHSLSVALNEYDFRDLSDYMNRKQNKIIKL